MTVGEKSFNDQGATTQATGRTNIVLTVKKIMASMKRKNLNVFAFGKTNIMTDAKMVVATKNNVIVKRNMKKIDIATTKAMMAIMKQMIDVTTQTAVTA